MEKFIGFILLIGVIFLIALIGKTPGFNLNLSKPSETPANRTNTNVSGGTRSVISAPPTNPATPLNKRVYIGSAYITGYPIQYFQISLYANLQAGETVDITGWQIKANRGNFIIPQAVEFFDPAVAAPSTDIILKPNNYVEIYGLASSISRNFRLNKCFGYLQGIYKFDPPVYTNCPYIFSADIRYLSGQCQSYIQSLGACQIPDVNIYNSFPGTDEGNACRAFLQNIGYGNCFRSHQNDADFFSNEWRVWLNQAQFLDSQHDYLRLYDNKGNLISEYNY